MNMICALLGFLCMVRLSSASWGAGPCEEFDVVTDLDLERYFGTWYHFITDSTFYWAKGSSCVRAEYTPAEEENYFDVVDYAVKGGEWTAFPAKGRLRDDSSYEVKFDDAPWIKFQVYDTDYDTYSIIYSCQNFELFHYNVNFLIAREQDYKPSQEQIDTIVMLGTKEEDLLFYNQDECPPFPEEDF